MTQVTFQQDGKTLTALLSGEIDHHPPYVPEKALELYKKAEIDGMYTDYAAAGRCKLG